MAGPDELFLYEPFTLRPGGAGPAVTADPDRHLHDKIIAVLFTSPGERVNQPAFGVGLSRALFEGLDELTVAAMEFRILEGLRRDLGDEVIVDGVDATMAPQAGELVVAITFRCRTDPRPDTVEVVL